jgi:hypothetical protein
VPAWHVTGQRLPFYECLCLDEKELLKSSALCRVYSENKLFIMTRINICQYCVDHFLLFTAVTPRGDYFVIYTITKQGNNGVCR